MARSELKSRVLQENKSTKMGSVSANDVLVALRQVLPAEQEFIALHEPLIAGREWDYIKDCLDSGWVSSVGRYVDRFEDMLAGTCGVKHAVATMNGTAALHLALVLAGVKAGDEVLMPSLTFIATANAATYCGAVPHFLDCDERSLCIDPAKLAAYLEEIAETSGDGVCNIKTGRRLAALVPMHTFGHPADMDALIEIAERWNIVLIEDAAESLGSTYKGKPAGSLGDLAALSFNGNKIITTGGGGAILTNDTAMADKAKHLSTTAKIPHKWSFDHDQVGYNYRLPNINAAMGCAQLEQLPGFVAAKRSLARRYQEQFTDIAGMRIFAGPEETESNYWLNTLLLEQPDRWFQDEILEVTNSSGFMTRLIWKPMHRLPMYSDCPRMDLDTTEELADRIICLPSSAVLGAELSQAGS